MEATVHMILEGEISELTVMLQPETFDKYIWCKHKLKAMMYIQLKSPIPNSTGSVVILETTVQHTTRVGIEFKDYDQCVSNKTVNVNCAL
jgi:hypothetical protein